MLQSLPPKAGVTGACFHTQLLLGCRGSRLSFPQLSIQFITIHRAVFSDQIESKLCFVQRACNWIKYPVNILQASRLPFIYSLGHHGDRDKGSQSFQTSPGLQCLRPTSSVPFLSHRERISSVCTPSRRPSHREKIASVCIPPEGPSWFSVLSP